jgi:hypothetical protein
MSELDTATCFINKCASYEMDDRGPIVLTDGTRYWACVEHWEAIIGIVGRQVTWEHGDAYRSPSEPA